jgi:hypothetical protein
VESGYWCPARYADAAPPTTSQYLFLYAQAALQETAKTKTPPFGGALSGQKELRSGYDSESAVRRVRTRTVARYVSRAFFSVSAPFSAASSVRWRITATPRFCSAITFGRSLLDAFKAIKTSFV